MCIKIQIKACFFKNLYLYYNIKKLPLHVMEV